MVTRRTLLAALPAGLLARPLYAAPIDLEWEDLVPPGGAAAPDLSGLVEHDEASSLAAQQPISTGVRSDWNGETVRIAGFMIPLDYSGTGVSAFMLVPYVGACIHVPPPPANQLILVTTERPYESEGLFEPIVVTGMFGAASVSTQLADIGYALSADRVEPYR
ncbi:DUF3299 domain-containing protein [Pseudoroseicyclus sp. H15]